jgi:hypothetical protein
MLRLLTVCSFVMLFCGVARCQEKPLMGAIDIHMHAAPDGVPRNVDWIDVARLAKAEGMRAIVLKNHYVPTADDAYLVRKIVPGIEVFGGIDLNLTVGGINPAAVENMAHVTGHYGRMVWMTSFDSEAQVASEKGSTRPFVAVTRDGQLLPEVKQVIAIIAKYNLVLETGHNRPEQIMMMIREANRVGVKHIVVTHAMINPIHMNAEQMREAAGMGAYIEFVYNGLIGPYKEFSFEDYAKTIHAVGADHCILASDFGQVVNPVHTEGLKQFYAGLLKVGVTQAEIDTMARTNPAKILDLN